MLGLAPTATGLRLREMPDLRHLSDEALGEHLADVAGKTGSSLMGAYLELERRARARMVIAQENMVASQARVEASQKRAEALTADTAKGTETLVRLTWAILLMTLVNVLAVVISVI